MLSYCLSRLFTAHAEHLLPGRTEFGSTAKENMNCNRDYYRDTIIKSLQVVFEKFDSDLQMETENTGVGKSTLRLISPGKYPFGSPVEIHLSTECSDLLLILGREAAFCFERNGEKEIFYYGNSHNPDNGSQLLGMPNYIGDVREIAGYISSNTYAGLYAEYRATIVDNEPDNKDVSVFIIR